MKTTYNHHTSFAIIIGFLCLSIIGVSVIPLLNFQLNPSRTSPSLSVTWNWHNASARVIEMEVTAPMEGLFNSIKGVKEISSVSYQGSGKIDIRFKDHVKIDALRFEVASLIRQIYPKLPNGVSFPQISLSSSGTNESPILTYTLAGSASPYFIQQYAEERILPHLKKVKGLKDVSVYGASPFEWEITFQTNKARELGIKTDDVRSAVENYFGKTFAGMVNFFQDGKSNAGEISAILQTQGYYGENTSWETIPVRNKGGRIIYLTDVATIRYKEQQPSSYYRINGLNTINMVIYPEKGINHIRLAKDIKYQVKKVQSEMEPGYSILLAWDSTDYLNKELNKIATRSALALGILLLFVALISRKVNYLFLIIISMVANLSIAAVFFYFLKIEIHLYSLAGLTISFGLIIDNSIIMIDHYRVHQNKKVFLAILASTLTTIGALCIVFLLEENQKVNLIDFALVIIISLAVSMAVALFFIPAVMNKMPLHQKKNKSFYKRKRRVIRFNRIYERFLCFIRKYRWVFIILLALGFGLPVQWLPAEMENKNESFWADLYNKSLGSSKFKEEIKPSLEKILGGSLRLFTNYVFENASYQDPERTTLYVNAAMPEGCTLQQLNETISLMENFISQFEEVEMFQSAIYSAQNGRITINFTPEHENGSFPYFLKSQLESKANDLGGADWGVYGVGRGFSNAIHTGYKSSRIKLTGYNYEQLYEYAELLRSNLLKNERIKEVDITGDNNWWSNNTFHEYLMTFDKIKLILHEVSPLLFYEYLQEHAIRQPLSPIFIDNRMQQPHLVSDKYQHFNVWDLYNTPISIQNNIYKAHQVGSIEKRKSGNNIHKHNQQYQLVVAFNFIGPHQLEKRVKDRHTEEMNEILPLGYKAETGGDWRWDAKDKQQYLLILWVLTIIFFICSILFESLMQPLAIIGIIPLAFIGVFLTFYFLDFNFDQGGFASFILLCGIVVNAGVFIINDYNNYKKQKKQSSGIKTYLKAFNHKIIPILLTLISSILGLIPFVIGQKEIFWFAFAAGSIGGLIFSVLAIFIYLPLFVKLK